METLRTCSELPPTVSTWGQMQRSCNKPMPKPPLQGGVLVFQSRQYKSVFESKKIFLEATKGLSGESGKKLSSYENFYMWRANFFST